MMQNSNVKILRLIYLGFTWGDNSACPFPVCIVCGGKFSKQSMVPTKLKRHFSTTHSHLIGKNVDYFRRLLEQDILQTKLMSSAVKPSQKVQIASYIVT
jgi:hypothetical protein